MPPAKISIIGAGNVATHLALRFDKIATVVDVYSRNIAHAEELADKLSSAVAIGNLEQINPDSDYYIISVSDDAIKAVVDAMPQVGGIVAHTSGSVGIETLESRFAQCGVFYPLQTFSKSVDIDVSKIPFFIEASTDCAYDRLTDLALATGASATKADSALRAKMHLAAVFACNFANHMWSISADLLQQEDLEFNMLQPLLTATLEKAIANDPRNSQTGPAARGDIKILEKHEEMLPQNLKNIYNLLSQSIMAYRHEQNRL